MDVAVNDVDAEVLSLQHENDLGELCRQLGHFLKAERQLRTDEVTTLREKLEAILLTAAAMQGNCDRCLGTSMQHQYRSQHMYTQGVLEMLNGDVTMAQTHKELASEILQWEE